MRKWNEIHQKQQNIRKSNKESFKNLQEIDSHFSISVFPIRGSRERWIEILFTSCRNKWLRTTQKTTRKPKRLSFFCAKSERIGALFLITPELVSIHTRLKTHIPFYRKVTSLNRPFDRDTPQRKHTNIDYLCSLSSTFCLILSLPPLFIYGSKEEQREKNRQKSEVSPATTIGFDNYTLQNKPKTLFFST